MASGELFRIQYLLARLRMRLACSRADDRTRRRGTERISSRQTGERISES